MFDKSHISESSKKFQSVKKPKLQETALFGVAGSIVKGILPHSEADEAALLSQLLTAFGNIIGRSPHFLAESDRHGTNLFCLQVGDTAKGRKGTSWGRIASLLSELDPNWLNSRVRSGLSSGEGLIESVKDAEIDHEKSPFQSSSSDKRLLCLATEFGSVLRVCHREGNILSAMLRDAWDGRTLTTMTKNSPANATNPHISLIGHITKIELTSLLNEVEISNGLGNRFLFFYVARSKVLPEGGQVNEEDSKLMVRELRASVEFATTCGLVQRNSEAKEYWSYVYEGLSEGKPGLVGTLSSRGEAQVMRLALILALINRDSSIQRRHLEAALAIFNYSIESLRYIYGWQTGNRLADTIRELLDSRPNGLTRTEIRDLTHRNYQKDNLDAALDLLQRMDLAYGVRETTKPGRPTEIWKAHIG